MPNLAPPLANRPRSLSESAVGLRVVKIKLSANSRSRTNGNSMFSPSRPTKEIISKQTQPYHRYSLRNEQADAREGIIDELVARLNAASLKSEKKVIEVEVDDASDCEGLNGVLEALAVRLAGVEIEVVKNKSLQQS